MGYLGDAPKTRETFDRGFWLLSGDMATIDDGFVTIKGRIKDVIITSGGKNIAPYPIEEKIKGELADFVSNCVVVGDKQKHLACLITVRYLVKRQCPLHHYPGLGSLSYSVLFVRAVPDPLTMEATPQMDAAAWEWCRGLGCKPESIPDLVNNRHKYEAVWDGVMEALEAVNKVSQIEYPSDTKFNKNRQGSSSKAAKVRKFVILPTEFSIGGGELGPTMKIKRHVVESK